MPQDDAAPPKQLKEKSGVHKCIRCLRETPADAYFANDHFCDECAAEEDEGGRMKDRTMNDER